MFSSVPQQQDGNLILVDMLQIISKIRERIPGVVVESLGKPHVLVEIVEKPRKPSRILFVLVWLLLFFGSALTIMNFHADVSMMEVQVRIVEMITGHKDEHPYLFQIAYSIGIGFGMIVFFNHLFKKMERGADAAGSGNVSVPGKRGSVRCGGGI